ncbi:SDR family NAD(P)-dependent oxidoreductase [Frateuria defendens]|uniref:SDR family NAD(P)-dependent oxidoreductase n=1 Tax=Frateuria defendens TaxID=2219559 RepID=UPI00066FC83E|nr:SDR family NAD(P)-dependent oxidoreductase [Frateuria defendens]
MPQKIVLVTGASSGFGLAIAQRFARRGDKVIATARRLDRLEQLAAENPNVLPLAMDVTDRAQVAAALETLPEDWRAIDVLVNNAGLALGLAPAPQASLDQWDTMIATNCAGLATVTRLVLPGMVERGRGQIINIGSTAGSIPYAGGNVYGATKAFVHQFTNNLNADLVGSGVHATCVEPGLAGGTEFSQVRFDGDADKAAAVYKDVQPLTAEDIADAVEWVADRPPHVTINYMVMMPDSQSFGGQVVKRGGAK